MSKTAESVLPRFAAAAAVVAVVAFLCATLPLGVDGYQFARRVTIDWNQIRGWKQTWLFRTVFRTYDKTHTNPELYNKDLAVRLGGSSTTCGEEYTNSSSTQTPDIPEESCTDACTLYKQQWAKFPREFSKSTDKVGGDWNKWNCAWVADKAAGNCRVFVWSKNIGDSTKSYEKASPLCVVRFEHSRDNNNKIENYPTEFESDDLCDLMNMKKNENNKCKFSRIGQGNHGLKIVLSSKYYHQENA